MMRMAKIFAAGTLLLCSSQARADDVGATKSWGAVQVTLQSFAFEPSGLVMFHLLFKNNSSKEENISSLGQFQALSTAGDHGDFDFMKSKCDGAIPPNGLFKCSLGYKFGNRPTGLSLRVGAGILEEALYFNVGM